MKFWKLYREKGSNKMEKGVLCQNGSQWAEDIKNHLTGQGILGFVLGWSWVIRWSAVDHEEKGAW